MVSVASIIDTSAEAEVEHIGVASEQRDIALQRCGKALHFQITLSLNVDLGRGMVGEASD